MLCYKLGQKPNKISSIQSSNNNRDDSHPESKSITNDKLKLMLSFAVGGLLGDVFLHLLPEAHHKLYLQDFLMKTCFVLLALEK